MMRTIGALTAFMVLSVSCQRQPSMTQGNILRANSRRAVSVSSLTSAVDRGSLKQMNNKEFSDLTQSSSALRSPIARELGSKCKAKQTGSFTETLEEGTEARLVCSKNGGYEFGVEEASVVLWKRKNKRKRTELWKSTPRFDHFENNDLSGNPSIVLFRLQTDGNLVLLDDDDQSFVLWDSASALLSPTKGKPRLQISRKGVVTIVDAKNKKDILWTLLPTVHCIPDATLSAPLEFTMNGHTLCSPNGQYRFGLSKSGDVSLWSGSRATWFVRTSNVCSDQTSDDENVAVSLRFQRDGNLVARQLLESGETLIVWTSAGFDPTAEDPALMSVGNDGVLRVQSMDNVLWQVESIPVLTGSPNSRRTNHDGCVRPSDDSPLRLHREEYVCSPLGQYRFGLSATSLVLIDADSSVLWSAEGITLGADDTEAFLEMQLDGNLVLYRQVFDPIWDTQTFGMVMLWSNGRGDAVPMLQVDDDGVASISISYLAPFSGVPNSVIVWSTATTRPENVEDAAVGLDGNRMVVGYQGWFFADGDCSDDGWQHWTSSGNALGSVPSAENLSFELWPDLSEWEFASELYPTNYRHGDGSIAGLYSSYDERTVHRHLKWMQEYGIDGPFVQRFVIAVQTGAPTDVDQVLRHVQSGAEKYGRVFVVMYDLNGASNDGIVETIQNDWMHLVDDLDVTRSPAYLSHRSRPLVVIWGAGIDFAAGPAGSPQDIAELIAWFREGPRERYHATVMGGLPTGWRTQSLDSRIETGWTTTFREFDVISPWAPGRLDDEFADTFYQEYVVGDLEECSRLGIDYLPVVFPGFSALNRDGKPLNEIPRLRGDFLWHQLDNLLGSDRRSEFDDVIAGVYVAMFDEVDEGTAIYKVASTVKDTPTTGTFLTLDFDDVDGDVTLPSDWYLRLVGEAKQWMRRREDGGSSFFPPKIPIAV